MSLPSLAAPALILRDKPDGPTIFELGIGDSMTVERALKAGNVRRTIKLIKVEEFYQPDYWVVENTSRKIIVAAKVILEIDGKRAIIWQRPYQSPQIVGGLKIYIETTRNWANATFAALRGVEREVRLSVVAATENWAPEGFGFPLGDYRWRSAVYNNTWGSLVPYNVLYYHRGEDFGAIPGHLPVIAAFNGKVTASAYPSGDGRSNSVDIQAPSGLTLRYAHMDNDGILTTAELGAEVKRGDVLAHTGMTYRGEKLQTFDPHLHTDLRWEKLTVSPFPYYTEGYFRTYPDAMLAFAGGYQFALPGETLELDATRSIARPGRKIVTYLWKLHDGTTSSKPKTKIRYAQPGLYTEELILKTDDGSEDRDYAQVRVFDPSLPPAEGQKIGPTWALSTPVRDVKAGTTITFWNRIGGTPGPFEVDFGDGSQRTVPDNERQFQHSYAKSGIYTVSFSTKMPNGQPVTVKIRVVVEN